MSAPFSPRRALEVLGHHQVRYVLIGGLAAVLRGAAVNTNDLDVCHDRAPDNLERLVAALRELHAKPRVANVEEELPFVLDAGTLAAGDAFTFSTDAGDLDVIATPSGTRGFVDLHAKATTMDLGEGLTVPVVDLDDLIRMKEASASSKDGFHLEVLSVLREMIEEQEGSRQHVR